MHPDVVAIWAKSKAQGAFVYFGHMSSFKSCAAGAELTLKVLSKLVADEILYFFPEENKMTFNKNHLQGRQFI